MDELERHQQEKDMKKAFESWVTDKIHEWGEQVKPFYTKRGLEEITSKMRLSFLYNSGGFSFPRRDTVDFGGTHTGDYVTRKENIEKFLDKMTQMLERLSKGERDESRDVYNSTLGDRVTGKGDQSVNGRQFLLEYVLPGCRLEGFVDLISDDIKSFYLREVEELGKIYPKAQAEQIATKECLDELAMVKGEEEKNKVLVSYSEIPPEKLKAFFGLGMAPSDPKEKQ